VDKVLAELQARRAELALSAFDAPPSDWSAFQRMLGRYCEIVDLIDIVKRAMSGKEDEE
jgi:uncharacterized protein (DUF2236 family)